MPPTSEPTVLFADNHLLVLCKPAGMPVQPDLSGDLSLLDWGKAWVKREYDKPGDAFLGLVHRLDRPVSGVVLLARTSKAASRLSEQFRRREIRKIYWALAEGEVPEAGVLEGKIERRSGRSRLVESGGKEASLAYRRLGWRDGVSWVEVDLGTGRHHQIRLQFAAAGHPLLGDFRYGPGTRFGKKEVALHARELTIVHPTTGEALTFVADPAPAWEPYTVADDT